MSAPEDPAPPVKVKLESSNVLGAGLGAGCLFAILGFLGLAGFVLLATNGSALGPAIAPFWPLAAAAIATALIVLAVRAWRHSKRPRP